jgi:hypothetical protein
MARLSASDFVCLVTRAPENWPFDRQMAAMLPEARSWCERNLKRDGDLVTEQFSASVYERPGLGRPAAPGGVDLAAMLAAGARGRADAAPVPPAAPVLADGTFLWTTRAEFRHALRAAYSPVTYRADGLPGGLELDPETGEIRGWFRKAGEYGAGITARNAAGSSTGRISFRVTDEAWNAEIHAPEKAVAGVPIEVRFAAFDAAGTLDFIDVSDVTTGKALGRIAAGDGEKRNWQGACSLTFRDAGPHALALRFVRFDAAGAPGYSFMDRGCTIEVAP